MQIKTLNFRSKVPNTQPCIAAHLQGTQSQRTIANLAKELQLPLHSDLLFIATNINQIFNRITTLWYWHNKMIFLNCLKLINTYFSSTKNHAHPPPENTNTR